MGFVLGLITLIRMTRNMPKKMTAIALYGNSVLYDDDMMKAAPAISIDDRIAVMKRMADLEEKVNNLITSPSMPPEMEKLLNTTLSRVETLEQELATTQKVPFFSILRNFIIDFKTYF